MKIVFSVGLREYDPELFIAHTFHLPRVSTAAATAATAIAQVRAELKAALESAHPRMIWALQHDARTRHERRIKPLFRSAHHDWAQGGSPKLTPLVVEAPVDVIIRGGADGVDDVSFPVFGVSTAAFNGDQSHRASASEDADDDDAAEEPPLSPVDVAIEDLVREVRKNDRSIWMHRPAPRSMTIVEVEVDFEPLNLERVDVDALWSAVFSDEMFIDHEVESVPATPVLDEIGQCWSTVDPDDADDRGFQAALHRQRSLEEVRNLLFGDHASAVVVVGPARVGKTSLIQHLAWEHIQNAEAPERRIWFADSPRLASADPMVGWQEQCRKIVAELEDTGDVLYLGRLSEALDAGKYFGSDYNIAQFLKPTLTDRRIRVVAEATIEEWSEIERRDIGFARAFTVIRLEDPREPVALRIVRDAGQRLSARYGVELAPEAVSRAWGLQKRFSTEGSPVGRSIDFLARTLRQASNSFKTSLSERDIVESFCRDTGLPPVLLLDDIRLELGDVRTTLAKRVMGQDEAVRRVADVIGITKAGLASEDRPLGSFLFVGPTGVGKTELARALGEFLFGTPDRLVRIDMSEYSHGDAYSRLIGEGRDEGDLTGPVKRQPFSVVLLDELEKAHPSVFDLLLQVLGEARLTDARGKTTRFQNTIIVMTSNLGVDSLRPAIGFGSDASPEDAYAAHFRREAERFFRPEFLARIDQFIPFHSLPAEIVEAIAARELGKLTSRDGLFSQDVSVEFAPELAAWLAKRGWDEKYGARPLKRAVEQDLVWRLAEHLSRTQEALPPGATRLIKVAPETGDLASANLAFSVEYVSGETEANARQRLLAQIEEISELRRRLQRYTYTNVFSDLEWEVDNFDLASQSTTFWQDPNAASMATRAEQARRVIEPAQEVIEEFGALEDLASEAYHSRTFALATDITERVEELQGRVTQIILTVLRAAYDDPDHAALFLVSKNHEDPWRAKLIDWYMQRARAHGWKVKMWRPNPDLEDAEIPEGEHYDEQRRYWERTDTASSLVVGLEFEGYAVRALMRGEDGLQRLVSSEGNAVVEVIEMDEYDGWPFPQRMVDGRSYARVVRTYNFRTNEVLIPGYEPVKLVLENPWKTLEATVEDYVWEITEMEWE